MQLSGPGTFQKRPGNQTTFGLVGISPDQIDSRKRSGYTLLVSGASKKQYSLKRLAVKAFGGALPENTSPKQSMSEGVNTLGSVQGLLQINHSKKERCTVLALSHPSKLSFCTALFLKGKRTLLWDIPKAQARPLPGYC